MKVYDFDGSIYQGNLIWDFYRFCLRRQPRLLCSLPHAVWCALCACFGARPWDDVWAQLYASLLGLSDAPRLAEQFWSEARRARLNPAYLERQAQGDLLLSRAPEYLFAPLKQSLGMSILGAHWDLHGGFHANREGAERLRRIRALAPEQELTLFWGSRLTDHALAMKALRRYYVRGKRRQDWDRFVEREGRRWGFMRQWISPEFFRFWCVGWLNMAAAWLLEAFWGFMLPADLGFSVGYGMSLLVSFTLNSTITFHRKLTFHRLLLYILSYVPNFAVQFMTVLLLHNLLHWPYLLVCFLAAVVGTPVTFLCLKFFAFRHHAA